MRQCPVCGMNIDEDTAKEVVYNGRPYLVASDDCRERFETDPSKYVGPTAHADQQQHHRQHEHGHGCC